MGEAILVDQNLNGEILEELRSIRALLMMEKKDDLEELGQSLNEEQLRIVEELCYDDWTKSVDIKDKITEQMDISGRTFNRRINSLEQQGLIEKEGQKSGTMYRKTGLLRMALTLAEF